MAPTPAHPARTAADGGAHALVRRLPAGVGADACRTHLAAAAERQSELAGLRLWAEPVAVAAGEPAAEARRLKEAGRPASGLARITVLEYADGSADLVLAAHRDRLDRSGLAALADAVLGADVRVATAVGAWPAAGAAAGWGLADPAGRGAALTVPVPLPPVGAVDAKQLGTAARDALAATLAHYRPAASAVFAVADGDAVWSHTVADVVDPAAEPLTLREVAAAVAPAADGAAPDAGVFVVEDGADRYLPFVSAPFPVTITVTAGTPSDAEGTEGAEGADPATAPRADLQTDKSVLAEPIAAQFAEVFGRLLAAFLDGATDTLLEAAARLPESRTAEIVERGRTPGRPGFAATTVPAGVAAFAAARPDAPAVSDDDGTLTYAGLADRAGRIAAGLRGLGVRPGDRVAVCLGRDTDTIATMLGVMAAGAAYVPVDPAYPAERLTYTVADADARVVVVTEAVRGTFADRTTATVAELAAGAVEAAALTATATDAAAIAYVIYTSGSTGRPKGVAVPHANVAALVDATRDDMALSPADVWTFFHSGAFDFSVWEIWGCLLTGGHLVVVGADTARTPDDFHDLLTARRVTVLSQTPAAFAALQEADARKGGDLAVRLVVFGGEPLDTRMLTGWFRRHPATRCRLVNMFGITETTVHVTAQTVTPAEADARSRSVGRALPGWSVSVRDRSGAVLPYGVPGEVWVGGAGLADHYLNLPDLTAARFVADPVTGTRQYRSGDLGRLHPDGRLDHLGRIDSQVKLRGFRIELDEIRSVLLADPGVTAAAVLVHQGVAGDSATARLDAYVVVEGDRPVAEIRRRAAGYLPGYMVPSSVTAIPALPLTVNGKVDVARLRELPRAVETGSRPDGDAAASADSLDSGADSATGTGAPAGDSLLTQVLAAWSETLGETAGPDDDFFEYGGNSLLAVRLSGALRRAGLPTISMRELYVHATPAELTALLARKQADGGAAAGA